MPGEVTQIIRPAGIRVAQVNAPGAATSNIGLSGHTVEVDQPRGHRNPIVGALMSFGRLLTRCCTRSQPRAARNLSPEERATQDTHTHLSNLFRHLTAQTPRVTGAGQDARLAESGKAQNIAVDLQRLAAAHGALARSYATRNSERAVPADNAPSDEVLSDEARSHADQELQAAVEEMLDSGWPEESALELTQVLRGQHVATVQKYLHVTDPNAERLLVRIEEHVTRAIMRRANARMEGAFKQTFDLIGDSSLSTAISAEAEKAFGTARAVIAQLRQSNLLHPSGGNSSPRREIRNAEQTGQILQLRLAALAAHPDDLDTFLRHLDPDSLGMLVAEFPTDPGVAAAVQQEIDGRIPRLMRELKQEIEGDAASGRQRANTILTSSLNDQVQRVSTLREAILGHNDLFGVPLDQEEFHRLITTFDNQMSLVADAHMRPTGAGSELASVTRAAGKLVDPGVAERLKGQLHRQIGKQKAIAMAKAQAVLDTLATKENTGRTAAYLIACKDLVGAVQDYLLTMGVSHTEIAAPGRLESELRIFMDSARGEAPPPAQGILQVLRAPEMLRAAEVLREAASQAQQRGLPRLHAELNDSYTALEVVSGMLTQSDGSGSSRTRKTSTRAPETLEEQTRKALVEHFSTQIQPDGKVTLTAGACEPAFAARMKEEIERPFSAGEAETMLLDGILVPAQFWKDAERETVKHFGPDGEPLINRSNWGKLTLKQKETRVAQGYLELLRLYEGNEKQTAAIVLLANQAIAAGVTSAARYESGASPLKLPPYGTGTVNVGTSNGEERVFVRFFKGENHRPQLEIEYNIKGGRYDLLENGGFDTGHTVYLDRNRSRAKFTVTVEADAAKGKVNVVGTPTYDVHLVRSPIQRSFPTPKLAHFFTKNTESLYRAAIEYAERTDPAKAHALEAMQSIIRWQEEPQWRRLRQLYAQHLGPDAKKPLSPETDNVRRARESIEQIEQQTAGIFNAADRAAEERMSQTPSPTSDEIHTLAQFRGQIAQFKSNPSRSLEDATAILAGFPVSLDAVTPSNDPVLPLPHEVVASAHAAIDNVRELMSHELRPAVIELLTKDLSEAVNSLLPRFTQELQQAALDPDPIDTTL
jgi:hypothetical protein